MQSLFNQVHVQIQRAGTLALFKKKFQFLKIAKSCNKKLPQLSGASGVTGDQKDVTRTADKQDPGPVDVLTEERLTFPICLSALVLQRRRGTVKQVCGMSGKL